MISQVFRFRCYYLLSSPLNKAKSGIFFGSRVGRYLGCLIDKIIDFASLETSIDTLVSIHRPPTRIFSHSYQEFEGVVDPS